MTNCCNFSHVFYNHLNHPNASSNSSSYTFISHRWFSSRMSPPTDRGTSRSSSMGKLAGCLFQSIIKFILIFSPLIITLFFTILNNPMCPTNVNNLFPSMDWSHLFQLLLSPTIDSASLSFLPIYQWVNLLRCLLPYVKLPPVTPYG